MTCSTISRVRMHDLAGLGRSALMEAGEAGFREGCASPRRCHPVRPVLERRTARHPEPLVRLPTPSVGRSRPEADDLMEQVI